MSVPQRGDEPRGETGVADAPARGDRPGRGRGLLQRALRGEDALLPPEAQETLRRASCAASLSAGPHRPLPPRSVPEDVPL